MICVKSTLHFDRELEEAFLRAFENTLGVFGETTKDILLTYLEKNYSLGRDELTRKPDVFEEGLREAFHTGGWCLIKQMLVAELHKELQLPMLENSGGSLSKHLKNMRILLEKRKSTQQPCLTPRRTNPP